MIKVFPYFYFLFICSGFLFGQLYLLGLPANILQIMTIVMMVACFRIAPHFATDKYISYYFIFLIFYFISESLTGYSSKFFDFLKTYLFIGYIFYWATSILLMYNKTLKPLIYALALTGVIDTLVTIYQAYGIPISSPIIQMLIVKNEAQEIVLENLDGLGLALSGIYFSAVINGHILLFCFVTTLFLQNNKTNWIGIMVSAIILCGLFFCQQRSPLFIAIIALIAFVVFRGGLSLSKALSLIFFCIIVYFALLPALSDFVLDSGSRILSISDTNRLDIWHKCFDFFAENPVLGGYHEFVSEYHEYPHNLFWSSVISGGILGGIWIFIMLFRQFVNVFNIYRIDKYNFTFIVSAICYFALVLDSFSHNTGWVDGDYSTMIAWSVCYYIGKEIYENQISIHQK